MSKKRFHCIGILPEENKGTRPPAPTIIEKRRLTKAARYAARVRDRSLRQNDKERHRKETRAARLVREKQAVHALRYVREVEGRKYGKWDFVEVET